MISGDKPRHARPDELPAAKHYKNTNVVSSISQWIQNHPARAGTLAGWYVQMSSSISALVTVPLVLHSLSSSDAGLWFTFQSIVVIAAMSDFGFSLAFSRQIAWSLGGMEQASHSPHSPDLIRTRDGWLGVSDVHYASKRFFCAIALLAFGLMAILYHFLLPLGHLLDSSTREAPIAWYVLAVGTSLMLYTKSYLSLLEGTGWIYASNFLFGTYQLICGIGVIIALSVGGRLVAMASTTLFATIIFLTAAIWSVRREYSDLLAEPIDLSRDSKKKIVFVALPLGVLMMSGFLVSSIQVPLIGSLLGAASVSGFYLAQKIGQLLSRLVLHIANPQIPIFTREISSGARHNARYRIWRTTGVVAGAAALVFITYYCASPFLIRMWVGPKQYVDCWTLGLLTADYFILTITVALAQFVLASGRNPFAISTLLTGLLNLGALLILIPRIGIGGAAAASLVSGLCINYWFTVWQAVKTSRHLA
jgi:O-antigen/teichoic acid export membrane protein